MCVPEHLRAQHSACSPADLAVQTLLVGRKNGPPHPGLKRSGMGDILQNERLGQSQKPTALYRVIESLFPKDSALSPCPSQLFIDRCCSALPACQARLLVLLVQRLSSRAGVQATF